MDNTTVAISVKHYDWSGDRNTNCRRKHAPPGAAEKVVHIPKEEPHKEYPPSDIDQ